MLRVGWGVTGNQQIPSGRIVVAVRRRPRRHVLRHHRAATPASQPGFRQTSLGNADLKWEENRATNIGADLSLFNGTINVIFDVYQRNTNNLLFDPRPARDGRRRLRADREHRQDEEQRLRLLGRPPAGDRWNATLQGSHYRNEIVSHRRRAGRSSTARVATRFGNQVDQPGRRADRRVLRLQVGRLLQRRAPTSRPATPTQDGAAAGPHQVRATSTATDKITARRPHDHRQPAPGLHGRPGPRLPPRQLGPERHDLRLVRQRHLRRAEGVLRLPQLLDERSRRPARPNSWTPTNTNAKYPRLDNNDTYSNALSSFYVEDGSYVRMRNLQLGYNLPQSFARWCSARRASTCRRRTSSRSPATSGLDPSLPAVGHQRSGRRHPRSVPRHRPRRRTRAAGRSASASLTSF